MRWLFLFGSTYSTLYFSAFLLSVPFFHLSDEQQPELNKKDMEILCNSANKGGEDTYDFLYLPHIFQARVEGPRHHQYEDILPYVQKPPDDIRWTIDRTGFDEFIALKKDSAPGPDGIPYGAYKCAGGWAPSSFSTLKSICWKEVPSLNMLLKVGRSLSPRLLTSMKMEELFDHQTHFAVHFVQL